VHPGFRHAAPLLLALAFCAASCGKSAPTQVLTSASAGVTAAQPAMDQLDQLFTQGGLTRFDALGSRLAAASPVLAALPSPAALRSLATDGSSGGARSAVSGIAQRLVALAGSGPARPSIAVIAPGLLGRTFVFDTTLGGYVVDPARTGAPANGIRYVLYAEDTLTRRPDVSVETGWADLTDEGAALPAGFALRLRVHDNGIDILDYTVSVDGTRAAGTVEVAGFIANDRDRANFHVGITGVRAFGASQAHVDFWFELVNHDLHIAATINARNSAAPDERDVDEAVRAHGHLIHVLGQAKADSVNIAVQLDGAPFATISGLAWAPLVVGADGKPLDADEQHTLAHIVRTLHRVDVLIHCLLQPAHVLWALAHPPGA
jgi:hypothetical protein